MKILTVVGARPQFVKAAAVSRVISHTPGLREVLLHTGQHYDDSLSAVFFRELGLAPPDHQLDVGSASHGAQTGRMLEGIEKVLRAERPDWVLVYGDTNSTVAGALAAAKLRLPIAHVEAGLRSFNMAMPEEINRALTDRVSTLLLCPTETAVRNLAREGISGPQVVLTGDVMYDSVRKIMRKVDAAPLLARLGVVPGSYVLATIHRAENTDDAGRLRQLAQELARLADSRPVIMPLHPRTRAALDRDGLFQDLQARLRCIEPLGYVDMLAAEANAGLIVTDSGGVQKEAYFVGVPCLILRDETEWVELIELGCARLVRPGELAAAAAAPPDKPSPGGGRLYGGGKAAERVVAALLGQARVAAAS